MPVNVKLDSTHAEAVIRGGIKGLSASLPLMRALSQYIVGNVRRVLSQSGEPAGSFAPLKFRAGKPLWDTGTHIAGGIHADYVDNNTASAVSSFQWSAVHQRGATIKAHSRFNRYEAHGAGVLAFPGPGGAMIFAKQVTIPARPFMVFRAESPKEIEGIALTYVEGILGGAGGLRGMGKGLASGL